MNVATMNPNDAKNLDLMLRRIAIESMALEGFSDTVKRLVPSISTSVRTFLHGFQVILANQKGRSEASFSPRKFEETVKILDKHQFSNTMELRLYVPEGFNGNLLAYCKRLMEAQAHVNDVVGTVLTPYNTFLSKLVTSKSAVADTKMQLQHLHEVKINREKLTGQLADFFKIGATHSSVKVSSALERNRDWTELLEDLTKIEADFDPKRSSLVKEAVEHCSELLDALSNAAQEDSLRDISAQNLRLLGDATYEIAKEVEFFSAITYQVNSLLAVMAQNTEFLKKALSK